MKNKVKYRQGDVVLVKVAALPKGLVRKDNILALGETTGHRHMVTGKEVQVFKDKDGHQFIDCGDGTVLEHEEHGHIQLEEGKYEVKIQRELSMDLVSEVRQVAD